jgi:hypothetical protein
MHVCACRRPAQPRGRPDKGGRRSSGPTCALAVPARPRPSGRAIAGGTRTTVPAGPRWRATPSSSAWRRLARPRVAPQGPGHRRAGEQPSARQPPPSRTNPGLSAAAASGGFRCRPGPTCLVRESRPGPGAPGSSASNKGMIPSGTSPDLRHRSCCSCAPTALRARHCRAVRRGGRAGASDPGVPNASHA